MPDAKTKMPPDRGHPMPRRVTPENSVTLRHHRFARGGGMRDIPAELATRETTTTPRRNSSGESHDTGQSDPKGWFDRSNKNPMATYDANTMDVDPPFFQKETDSSNEDIRLEVPARTSNYPFEHGTLQVPALRPAVTHSSSADDYRSVIDDLTIENKRLREELKRYRQFAPDTMRKEKLFEIKVHGLPRRKKRELEATLRDFAASLGDSSEAASARKKSSKHANHIYSYGEGGTSKHASSSSSQSRPVDSAYASMSTGGPNSSGTSLGRPSMRSRAKSSELKVEHYLEEIPEGLYPGFVTRDLGEKEKKKIIVKKLEQLFTGKISGRNIHRNQSMPSMDQQNEGPPTIAMSDLEPSREAQIQPHDVNGKKSRSRDNLSSNSNGDQTESAGNGNGSGSGGRSAGGNNTSPQGQTPPEQRPTRPRDLDPDRIQIPSENMEYIRHLGLVPPELLTGTKYKPQNVSPDADGWVYLNLLSNLAQLHIFNVSPDFIRKAVCEKSAKFQLSPDGRKIRWRGGTEGTRFSSDSSGDNSQRSPSTDDDDGSDKNGQRKRQKTGPSGDENTSAPSSKNRSKLGPQISRSSDSFHYKPLFVHQSSVETSLDETGSQDSYQVEDSNLGNTGNSRWDFSGSGSSPRRRKRRADGAIVFYSGAPFCTDLSGDPGDVSPTTYMTSTGPGQEFDAQNASRPAAQRTLSGASLPFRPLTDLPNPSTNKMTVELDKAPELTADETDDFDDDESELDADFPRCDDPDIVQLQPIEPSLEPSGVGRVFPDDHFAVVVTTRRPCFPNGKVRPALSRLKSDETTDSIVGRLATMSTSSPLPGRQTRNPPTVEIEYMSGRLRRLQPVSLPPPATFFPPFSTSSESEGEDGSLASDDDEDEDEEILASSAEEILSQRANPHQSDNTYPDNEDLTSADEEDEIDPDHVDEGRLARIGTLGKRGRPMLARTHLGESVGLGDKSAELMHSGSSVATAGGAESGYISSLEDD